MTPPTPRMEGLQAGRAVSRWYRNATAVLASFRKKTGPSSK